MCKGPSIYYLTARGASGGLARNVGKDDEDCIRHLRQRLAVLLVRDNVALLCARTPTFPDPEVDGDADGL